MIPPPAWLYPEFDWNKPYTNKTNQGKAKNRKSNKRVKNQIARVSRKRNR